MPTGTQGDKISDPTTDRSNPPRPSTVWASDGYAGIESAIS